MYLGLLGCLSPSPGGIGVRSVDALTLEKGSGGLLLLVDLEVVGVEADGGVGFVVNFSLVDQGLD